MIQFLEMQPAFGHGVQTAPDEVVKAHHENAHDADAQRDARKSPLAVISAM
jgi:hypothetical protein